MVCHSLRCCHTPPGCTCAQFGSRELSALPDSLYEQTSLRELTINRCPAAQQLIVSKLTDLTVLQVRVVDMSASAGAALILAPTQLTNGA